MPGLHPPNETSWAYRIDGSRPFLRRERRERAFWPALRAFEESFSSGKFSPRSLAAVFRQPPCRVSSAQGKVRCPRSFFLCPIPDRQEYLRFFGSQRDRQVLFALFLRRREEWIEEFSAG